MTTKGQLISKCLFEKIVWTKIPRKNLIDSALQYFRAESIKFFRGILVQTIFPKRHFETNRPLKMDIKMLNNFSDICAKETGCVITTLKSSVKIKTKTFSVSTFRKKLKTKTAKLGR